MEDENRDTLAEYANYVARHNLGPMRRSDVMGMMNAEPRVDPGAQAVDCDWNRWIRAQGTQQQPGWAPEGFGTKGLNEGQRKDGRRLNLRHIWRRWKRWTLGMKPPEDW